VDRTLTQASSSVILLLDPDPAKDVAAAVAAVPNPRLVLAPGAVDAPVPPEDKANTPL